MHLRTPVLAFAPLIAAASPALGQGGPPFVSVPPGFGLVLHTSGLDFPTAIEFAGSNLWITEGGFLPGVAPKIKRIDGAPGSTTAVTILSGPDLPPGALLGPLTDISHRDGWLWITHHATGANGWRVGAISRFQPGDPVGTFTTVITNLPSAGDHHTDALVFGADGRAYFSIGTATNSSVVGPDNEILEGWLAGSPTFHDYPAKDVVLSGLEFQTLVPFVLDPTRTLHTPPFAPFGSGFVPAGAVVTAPTPAAPQDGMIAGNGAVYSFDPASATPTATLRLEAWGFRNPYGLGFDPADPSRLIVSNNGADIRAANLGNGLRLIGAHPIANDLEDVFAFTVGGTEEYFGWPDFFHHPTAGIPLPITDPIFCNHPPRLRIRCPEFVFDAAFRATLTVEPALVQLELNSSANKFDFSTNATFQFMGNMFIAETGAFAPTTGATQFTGHKIVRVDLQAGTSHDFLMNTGANPAQLFDPTNFNKPIDVRFRDATMLVVDLGVFVPSLNLVAPASGKIWALARP